MCIDYCNGLLASCPRYLTDKLHEVLRAAARYVIQLPYRSSVSELIHRQLHWLDVVDRLNFKIGLLVYKCLHGLAPGYLSEQMQSGFNFRRPCQHALILEVGPTTVRPMNLNKDTGSTRVLLRLVCRVELAPSGLAWSRTLVLLLQNKLKSYFFIVDWFFFPVFHSCTLSLSIAFFFFAVHANVMLISWRVQMSELNWIE